MLQIDKRIVKVLCFTIVCIVMFFFLNEFMQPRWKEWNNYDTLYGFYEEKENTIETIFLGSSVVITGIDPMRIYEDYGVCTYNLGTEQQPVFASYYWLEEAYRLHGESLKTVVFEVSMLRRDAEDAFYRKALDAMQFSSVKYRAVHAYSENLNKTISCLVPLFSYHTRWAELEKGDFTKRKDAPDTCTRGYWAVTEKYIEENEDEMVFPTYYLNNEAETIGLADESEKYFRKIVSFCQDNSIELVLIKTPAINVWSSELHNAVELLAEEAGVPFYDFNFLPLIDRVEYNHALDSVDGIHLNYYGAQKLSDWLGLFLWEQCAVTDVRGVAGYEFMETRLNEYKTKVTEWIKIKGSLDPAEYLSLAMNNPNYAVFVAVKDDAASFLSEQQRNDFGNLGLKQLSELSFRSSYIAVIEGGKIVHEEAEKVDLSKNDGGQCLAYKGELSDDVIYCVESGGLLHGDIAICKIDGVEYGHNSRGINIVIYDKKSKEVVDVSVFDTCESSYREPGLDAYYMADIFGVEKQMVFSEKVMELFKYNRKCESIKNAIYKTEDGLLDYLKKYMEYENMTIYISAMDDAASSLDNEARKILSSYGLTELENIGYRDSYIAVIEDGIVEYEEKNNGIEPLRCNGDNYQIVSGGLESGNCSSIFISGKEYSNAKRGLNIVVYDRIIDMVIDQVTFDTHEIGCDLGSGLKEDVY